jgi:hypothetical protein
MEPLEDPSSIPALYPASSKGIDIDEPIISEATRKKLAARSAARLVALGMDEASARKAVGLD